MLSNHARIQYDPHRHGRNAEAIRSLNEQLRNTVLGPVEFRARLQSHIATSRPPRTNVGKRRH